MAYDLKINGERRSVDVDGDTPLLWVIRDVLGMTGTQVRMRHCTVRRLHSPYRWRACAGLPDAGRERREFSDHDDRGDPPYHERP